MTRQVQAINVYSQLNDWIDFVVILENQEETEKAEEIINKAADRWFEDADDICDTFADYVCFELTKAKIKHDIYFKENTDEDE